MAYLEGTVRTFSNELRAFIKTEIDNLLKAVTSKVGGTYEFEYIYEYDPVHNTSSEVDIIKEVVIQTLGKDAFFEIFTQSMGAEDFSKYIILKQGAIAWLGTKKDESTSYSLHHPLFNLDENALINGALTFVNLVIYHQKG
jgi:amidohydrolase